MTQLEVYSFVASITAMKVIHNTHFFLGYLEIFKGGIEKWSNLAAEGRMDEKEKSWKSEGKMTKI